eukprot:6882578-Karenia_brevis.AAC.1
MKETRDTGLRTSCTSAGSEGPRNLHSPVEDDNESCPDLTSSSSESDDEDKYNDFDTDETDESD